MHGEKRLYRDFQTMPDRFQLFIRKMNMKFIRGEKDSIFIACEGHWKNQSFNIML